MMSQNLRFLPFPLSHNVTLRRPPPPPLTCDVIYGCSLSTIHWHQIPSPYKFLTIELIRTLSKTSVVMIRSIAHLNTWTLVHAGPPRSGPSGCWARSSECTGPGEAPSSAILPARTSDSHRWDCCLTAWASSSWISPRTYLCPAMLGCCCLMSWR